jgi:hypothetical protein
MRRVRSVGRPRGALGEISRTLLQSISAGAFTTRELAALHKLSVRHAVVTVSNLRAAGYVRDQQVRLPDGSIKRALEPAAPDPQLPLPDPLGRLTLTA